MSGQTMAGRTLVARRGYVGYLGGLWPVVTTTVGCETRKLCLSDALSAKTKFICDRLFRVAAESVYTRTATTESAAQSSARRGYCFSPDGRVGLDLRV